MDVNQSPQEMTSRDYVRVIFRHLGVIFVTIITVVATVVVGVLMKTPTYEAEVKMLISGHKQAQAEYYTDIGITGLRGTQITLTQSEIVTSDPVVERAVSVLGLAQKPFDYEKKFCSALRSPFVDMSAKKYEKRLAKLTPEQKEAYLFRMAMEDLKLRLEVDPIRDTDLFLIKVKDFNPVGAAVTANVVSRSYTIFDLEQQLAEMQLKFGDKNQAVIQLQEAIAKMSKNLNGAPLSPIDAIGPATVKIIEQAKVPLKPEGLSRPVTVILGFFLSLFLSVMMAFSYEYMDQTFRTPQEAAGVLGLDYLGSLPKKARSDDLHELSEQLYFVIKNREAKSLLFTTAMPDEGVTRIISSLGEYIAENLHKKVLLIDGNLRNPTLHKMFKLEESRDLIDILEGKLPFDRGIKSIDPNLHVITSGSLAGPKLSLMKRLFAFLLRKPPVPITALKPLTALESQMMKNLIKIAREKYDLVLVDSAPLREYKDAAILSTVTDGVIVVVKDRKTRRHVVKNALEPLKVRKANILGLILNNRRFVIPKMIYDRV
jgi:Mrp family chromosome partitioning ATPase